MGTGMFPAISINKDITVVTDSSSPVWAPESKGTQEGKEYLWFHCHQTAATPYLEPEGAHDMKITGYWSQIAEIHMKGMIWVSWVLHLPMHCKLLNSLTWDICFFIINNTLLMFRLPPISYKPPYNLTPPSASSEQFSESHLRCCLLCFKS